MQHLGDGEQGVGALGGSTKRRRVMMSHLAAPWEAWWQQAAGKKHSVYACVCVLMVCFVAKVV